MKRLITTLGATVAALAASAGTAFAAGPVQSGTQSSGTSQTAIAASSATQVQPSNQNISVRVLSPGNDGSVSQSNTASSSANATNTASTTQNVNQTAAGCGCVVKSGRLDDVLGTAMQAAAGPQTAQAAPTAPTTSQANGAGSAGTAANTAPTSQASSQAAPSGGGGGVQSSQQSATTDQVAAAGSSATQIAPSNSNISVRVLSPGNDGNVTQSNEASSDADATNSATTTQGSSQTGGGSGGVQSSTQDAGTAQGALAESSAKQVHPENSNISVRVLSPGGGGSVSQSNTADSSANAKNTAGVDQTANQKQLGSSCGCERKDSKESSGGKEPVVQAEGQSSSVEQGALAASSATQIAPSNVNNPIRIASTGDDGRVGQSNETSSEANASNAAPVRQTATQDQEAGRCGCSSDPAVQAAGQSSEVGQLAIGLSSAKQVGASNESSPVRVWSSGGGGSVSQSNEADSSADATNSAPVTQTATQDQSGSGIQALGQDSAIGQIAFAASSAEQLPGKSRCGCDSSFGNSSDPVRIWSRGDDGSLTQENTASSEANASNTATPTQMGTQRQDAPCGCGGSGIQALGQYSTVDQIAAGLSSAHQIGASNESGPVRIKSRGDGGRTRQSNTAWSSGTGSNAARILQTGQQLMA